MQRLDVSDDRYQTLSAYSKGMPQKILIAATGFHNPRVAAASKIMIFSFHVLDVVEQVCSRVVMLNDGHVVGHDSVDRLRSRLQLPSLDAVFAGRVRNDDVEARSRGLVEAMRA